MNRLTTTAFAILTAVGATASAQNLAPNPSYEDAGPGFIVVDQWTNFTTPADVAQNGEIIPNGGGFFTAQDGSRAIRFTAGGAGTNNQLDTVFGIDTNYDGIEDRLPVTPGEEVHLSGWLYHPSVAQLQPRSGTGGAMDRFGSQFFLETRFYDANGDYTGTRIKHWLYEGRDTVSWFVVPPVDEWTYFESESVVVPEDAVDATLIWVLITFGDPGSYIYADNVYFGPAGSAGGCNAADLAEPFGVLDLGDIGVFVSAFTANMEPGDLNDDGIYDLTDIGLFVTDFTDGCP